MSLVTRFAPSPTGYLHIGGARTALFNWLLARGQGGTFRLRIEDTDRERSTPEAIQAILDGLGWLGLDWDGEVVYQSQRQARHAEIAQGLLQQGQAYYCYCTKEELQEMRERALAEGRPPRYDGRWRDRDPSEAPAGVTPVVRFKAPLSGETTIADAVQGEVQVANTELDDMVLLRGDGSPTYMLSVVVDDHDMGVTHVVRGDDHLNNAFRQIQLYYALGWPAPTYAHIPLIHGSDGAKMSKRHGSVALSSYRDSGYLPEALRNYLLRLGWAHGDEEIVPTERALEIFSLAGIGRSPARFDPAKLDHLNAHYLREADDERLLELIRPSLEGHLARALTADQQARVRAAMDGLKPRAKGLNDLADHALFLAYDGLPPLTDKAAKQITPDTQPRLAKLRRELAGVASWDAETLEAVVRAFAEREDIKMGKVAQPLRAALTGSTVSPGIFDVLVALGRQESLRRLAARAGEA